MEPLKIHQFVPHKPLLSFPWSPNVNTQKHDHFHVLSTESLEMCTESLGSESGSNIDEFHCIYESPEPHKKIKKKVKQDILPPPPPPPLSGGVRVQSHHESGRLVIKAFPVSQSNSCCHFQTERGNGRLRLSLRRMIEEEEDVVDNDISAEWHSSRCNCDVMSRIKSLPFCVAIS